MEQQQQLVVLLESAGGAGDEIDEVEELDARGEAFGTLTDIDGVGRPWSEKRGVLGQVHVMSLSENEGRKGSAERAVSKRRSMASRRESTCSSLTKTETSIVESVEQSDCDSELA